LTQWRKESQWFEMLQELAMDVISNKTYYPKFKDIDSLQLNIVTYTSMFNILKVSKLVNQTLTYLFFSKHGHEAHPFLWELEMIMKN